MGPYEVVRRLGAGGMGVVYLAHAPDREFVAVKVMNPGWVAQSGFQIRFEREVEAIRRVAPFCTAPVLDAAIEGDLAYIVTEYVEGDTLWQTVKSKGPLAGARLESVAVGTAVALTAIHRAGVTHRDLKPGNVILSPEGPKVIDFGVARLAESTPITGDVAIGTPPFMSPEQALGERVTHASDVFSWGAVVAFAATGHPPFGRSTGPEVFYCLVHERPDLTGLPDGLALIVNRAMDKRPGRRPTARDLIDVLVAHEAQPNPLSRPRPHDQPAPQDQPAPHDQPASADQPVEGGELQPVEGGEAEAEHHDEGVSDDQHAAKILAIGEETRLDPVEREGDEELGPRGVVGWLLLGAVICSLIVVGIVYLVSADNERSSAAFDDDFDTKRGWLEREHSDGVARYFDGGYLHQLPPERGMAATAPVKANEMGDVRVVARVRLQGGAGSYGIWCGGNPVTQATNRYDFYLTSARTAGIVKELQNGARQELRPLQAAPGITGGENRMEAECRFGDGVTRLRLRVNGRLVATYDDRARPHGAGACGTAAISEAGSTATMTVRYESFSVRSLRE
ncbi:serine/threonine-protein kinase [Actinomadura rudentiformis]|uniref:Serine/threonine protein kinase n=1 Tax=Actinomadura rudentiformis TaxID=359158 RepID=A0A6H9YLZ2_9ACTN|nr:serine/threonine-protein kinase [Actinomadura rudentiformis]KAB2341374.1 serine/threonine protein kinase [Actinomadura rudentiformis]